jgi:hypothetical protein
MAFTQLLQPLRPLPYESVSMGRRLQNVVVVLCPLANLIKMVAEML